MTSNPYLADRATLRVWADDGDADAAKWLRDYPDATLFGIDDDAIQAWFASVRSGDAWLAMLARDTASRRPAA